MELQLTIMNCGKMFKHTQMMTYKMKAFIKDLFEATWKYLSKYEIQKNI